MTIHHLSPPGPPPSALEGRYAWFGLLTALELVAAAVGCLVLWRRRRTRWMAWWVALVVALHFLPLAWLLSDWSLVGLGLVQTAALFALRPRLVANEHPTSRLVGPVMGLTLLAFGLVSAAVYLARQGLPFGA